MSKKNKESDLRKEANKLHKKEKRYLNSKARVVSRLFFGIIEFILLFILMMFVTSYMQTRSIDSFELNMDILLVYLQPGGMIFNALVGFLPIIALSCIGVYFGEGTIGKMLFGIIKCIAIIIWLIFIFQGASTSISMPDAVKDMGLEDLTVGLEGLIRFATLVLVCSILIPIGEYAGARKKHKRALEHKKEIKANRS